MTINMDQLLKIVLRRNRALIKYGFENWAKQSKMLTVQSSCFMGVAFPYHLPYTYQPESQHNLKKLFADIRTYSSKSNNDNNTTTNNFASNNNNGPRVIAIPKTVSRLGNKRKIREALEDRQRKIQKGMENVLEDKRVALTNTRKRIQEKGKLLMQDIKETKEKMKEKFEEVIEKENIYTIPNLLCVTRIGLSPLLGYLIVSQKFEYSLAFMIVAGLSDWFDGWIARNYKSQSSKIGSFLDPMADKVLIGTLFVTLTYVNLIPVPLTALIIGRDVILIISGFVIRYRSLPPPRTLSRYFDVTHATAQLAPTFISKVNTGVQLVLVATTLAAPVLGYVNHQFLHIMWYVTATSTVVAASSYIFSKETYKYLKAKEKVKNRRK